MKNTPLALLGFFLRSTPLAAMAQFAYTLNDDGEIGYNITITGYTGAGVFCAWSGAVVSNCVIMGSRVVFDIPSVARRKGASPPCTLRKTCPRK